MFIRSLRFKDYIQRVSREAGSALTEYFISADEHYYLRSLGDDVRKDVSDVHKQYPSVSNSSAYPFPALAFCMSIMAVSMTTISPYVSGLPILSSPNHVLLFFSDSFVIILLQIADDITIPSVFDQDQFFSSVFRIASPCCQLWTHYDVRGQCVDRLAVA